jgi:hypothetical protein
MKKFSTAALFVTAVAAPIVVSSAHAATAVTDKPPVSATDPRCTFLPNAPDQHTVVKRDTLWDISGKFLVHPWCWPKVWGMNQEDIRNPHWIYPGQIIYFDRANGRLSLTPPVANGGLPTVKLSPQVRTEALGRDAIRSIPSQAIEPYLSQPLIVEEDELNGAPRIVAADEERMNVGRGDRIYVAGNLQAGTSFQVFRPSRPLIDPATKKVIGHEATYLGTVKLVREARAADEAHVFTVVNSKEEISIGDRLIPMPPTPIINYVPHAPEQAVMANVVSFYGDTLANAGQNQIVTINRGRSEGVDVGTVLDLYNSGRTVRDKTQGWFGEKVKLPDQKYGELFIFRVFNHISYGLIMQVSDTVKVGDLARSPE